MNVKTCLWSDGSWSAWTDPRHVYVDSTEALAIEKCLTSEEVAREEDDEARGERE